MTYSGYLRHADIPGRYDTGPGEYPSPSDAAPERQHDILRYLKRYFISMLRQLNQVLTLPLRSVLLTT